MQGCVPLSGSSVVCKISNLFYILGECDHKRDGRDALFWWFWPAVSNHTEIPETALQRYKAWSSLETLHNLVSCSSHWPHQLLPFTHSALALLSLVFLKWARHFFFLCTGWYLCDSSLTFMTDLTISMKPALTFCLKLLAISLPLAFLIFLPCPSCSFFFFCCTYIIYHNRIYLLIRM